MTTPRLFVFLSLVLGLSVSIASAEDGNRLAYLDQTVQPYYPHRDFPRLTTPQWVGEPGVDCVVTLGIDDMRDPAKYEAFLRPILERLKKIDGRAPVSVMTCQVDPKDPQLAKWLAEGLSIECHTADHPCPCLQGGDFAKARGTYERCVDLISEIPGNRPVAFRMPCCDSLNTPSPRFWAEVFNKTTAKGRFLQIDSSVFNVITTEDASLPADIRLNEQGQSRFRRYIPFPSFVNTIEDYPYPYVIGGLCWEFPCVVPSDWSAQHVQKPNNPDTVRDLKLALDACVLKQGTFNLVFHPHGWIRAEQVIELIDHAEKAHGKRIKFLTFRECLERLNANLLRGNPLRNERGDDNGVRLIDLDDNGRMDVVRLSAGGAEWWSGEPERRGERPSSLNYAATDAGRRSERFFERELLSMVAGKTLGKDNGSNPLPTFHLRSADPPVNKIDEGLRYHDLDRDGICEVLLSNVRDNALFQWDAQRTQWKQLPFALPGDTRIVDAEGRDAGLRLVDIDGNRRDDVVFSNGERYSLYLFRDMQTGWSTKVIEGMRSTLGGIGPVIPPIVRGDGTNNGAWFHSKHLWVQNEDTSRLPNLVDRLAFDDMLQPVREREATAKLPPVPIGAAKIDITPDFPVRLSGYGNRKMESAGVAQKLWAKALAIGGDDGDGPALLLTLENCGLTPAIRDAVVAGLREAGVRNERVVIAASHSHTAPCLTNWAPFLFGEDIPPDHQKHIDQYTADVTKKLTDVAKQALAARRPARLSWGQGKVGFAANRRVLKDGKWTGFGVQADGPVDHSLPVLAARDEAGKLVAVVANYACHCTTLGGDFNQIAGDWAGYAQDFIEQDHPGCVALITIGCGADANPEPRRSDLELCKQHGRTLASEVKRLLAGELTPIQPRVECRLRNVDLPFDTLPTKEQWAERAKQPGAPGYHAQQFLARLERGEKIPETLSYPIATWTFGKDLAMVFLGGEVVVDYAMRFKSEFDASRLWITAYSNDVCCYIASQRILREGGYEADFSMYFYARPTRWAADVEDLITDTVQKLLPQRFYAREKQADFPPPKTPTEALAAIRVKPGFKVELVAAEPLVEDPVAFDWGADGSLWVVEMRDYPNGMQWNGPEDDRNQPGGRVKRLVDSDGDGRYDKATLFLDNIPYPNGIKVWGRGVLITAAPRVMYVEDRDGDGRADHQETLFEGFVEGNQQHRMNGLRWGLDHWLYLANGDSGGTIKSLKTGTSVSISGRDLRIRPDTGEIDAQAGQTQFGRNRDDWGNWFGGNNANPMWHYVLEDHYLRRNPHIAPPENRKHVSIQPGASPVFPLSRTLARFNDFNMSNRFTSACSPEVYRDDWLFPVASAAKPADAATTAADVAHVFICEPVHNLVHHEVMTADGVSFTSRRPDDEAQSEFFASSDNWSRPVMVRTGPDGALWIADMYRAVIEHPEWIPRAWQRKLDMRAGSDLGRIYRVVRADAPPRKPIRLDQLDAAGLVAALDSPNGWQRDLVQELLASKYRAAGAERTVVVAGLEKLSRESPRPVCRMQALCTLDGLGALRAEVVLPALSDTHPEVRRHAIRLSESFLSERKGEASAPQHAIGLRLTDLAADPSPSVMVQLAYAMGQWDERGGSVLARLALQRPDDPYLVAAVLSSVKSENLRQMLGGILLDSRGPPPTRLIEQLLSIATALDNKEILNETLQGVIASPDGRFKPWQLAALAGILDVAERRKAGLDAIINDKTRQPIRQLLAFARAQAVNAETPDAERIVAVRLLGRGPGQQSEDLETLAGLLSPRQPQAIQLAAAATLARSRQPQVPKTLTADWSSHSPTLRGQILDSLLSRDDWTGQLMGLLEHGDVPPAQIDARRRQQLLSHKSETVRKAAEKIFATAGGASRQKVLEQYRAALALAGDAARGKQAFAKRCSVCHRLEGVGHLVGPDLAAVGNKTPEALLIAMFDPNRAIEDRYLDYIVVTDDGRVLTGMLGGETGTSLTLLGQEGKTTTILRSEIDQLKSTGKSLMPEGLEKDLTPQDVADIVVYVRGTAPPFKSFPGNKPEVIRGDDGGALRLLATTARIYGPTLVLEDQYRNLGWWSSVEDFAAWSLEVPRAGRYTVSLDYACHNDAAGGRFVVTVGGQTLGGDVEGTGTWDTYRTKTIGAVELPAGPTELVMRSVDKIPSALIDLRGIRLIPNK